MRPRFFPGNILFGTHISDKSDQCGKVKQTKDIRNITNPGQKFQDTIFLMPCQGACDGHPVKHQLQDKKNIVKI